MIYRLQQYFTVRKKLVKKLLVIGVAAMAAAVALADGETWQSRAPLQDTFVHYDQPGAAFGNNTGIIMKSATAKCPQDQVPIS